MKTQLPAHLQDLEPVAQQDMDNAQIRQKLGDWRLERIGYDYASATKGRNFYLFKCPNCQKIFLADDETSTIYYDADYFGKYLFSDHFAQCTDCNHPFSGILYGEKAPLSLTPSRKEVKHSPWHWCLQNDAIYNDY